MRRALFFVLFFGVVLAQNPALGHITRNGNEATLVVNSPRPVDSAAQTLAQDFGIRINVEDPPYLFKDDVKDVTASVRRDGKTEPRVLIPKGGRLELHFAVGPEGRPADASTVVRSLVDAANARFPFEYRLDVDGDWFSIVATHTRDANGRIVAITPLLDRHVTIPGGSRKILESANMMAEALAAQTGLRVTCCQSVFGGFPWGMREIYFEAQDEPARSVLKRLLVAASGNQPNRDYWLQRCDPTPSGWCFINWMPMSR